MKRESISAELRNRVLERDDHSCVYCGFSPSRLASYSGKWRRRSDLHIDHIFPVARGGETVFENLVAACPQCNLSKHANLWHVPIAICQGCKKWWEHPEREEVLLVESGPLYFCPVYREDIKAHNDRAEVERQMEEAYIADEIAIEVLQWDELATAAGF